MESVIFLDIDGVLNSYTTKEKIGPLRGIEDKYIIILKDIVDLFNAKIVLSSSWKDFWSKDLFNDGINNWRGRSKKRYGRYLNIRLNKYGLKIYDKTDTLPNWRDRGKEIINYLDKHKEIKSFIILDDEDFMWERFNLNNYWVSTGHRDEQWDILNSGLKKEDFEYIKTNIDKFVRK